MNILSFPQPEILPLDDQLLDDATLFLTHCWHNDYAQTAPVDVAQQRDEEYFRKYLSRKIQLVWVAMLQQEIIGLMTVSSNCIDDLWVKESYRRRSIGRQLVESAFKHFSFRGFHTAQVGIESINEDAQKFFRAMQWELIGSQQLQLQSPPVSALVFSKKVKNDKTLQHGNY